MHFRLNRGRPVTSPSDNRQKRPTLEDRRALGSIARFESITDVADGVNVCGLAGQWLDFAAQRGDAAIDAPRGDDDRTAPNVIHDVVASESAAGAFDEILQQAKFLGR